MRKILFVSLCVLLLTMNACSLTSGGGTPSSSDSTTGGQTSDILLQDDFSSLASGWSSDSWEDGGYGYGDGYYYVIVYTLNTSNWGMLDRQFNDVVIEVEATQISGPANDNNAYGVLCHIQPDGESFYSLRVSGDGYYAIHRIENYESVTLVDWTPSSVIRQGNSTNAIRTTCSDSLLRLEVNDQLLAEVYDDTFVSGDIGLTASSFEAETTEVHFDDLLVRKAGEAAAASPGTSPIQPSSGILFEDDFSDPNSGWPVLPDSNFEDGYYYMIASDEVGLLQSSVRIEDDFDDLVIEVEATQVLAPANNNFGFGVGCRTQENGDGYQFFISGDGYYAISLQENQYVSSLWDWSTSSAVNQGNTSNTLRVTCSGTALRFEVNGQLLVEVSDSTFDSGYIALLNITLEEEPAEVHFDNLVVSSP